MNQNIIEITKQEEITKYINNNCVLLIFINPNGGPCQAVVSQVLTLLNKHEGKLKVLINDITKDQSLASAFGIRMLPTTIYYKKGEIKEHTIGALNEKLIETMLD